MKIPSRSAPLPTRPAGVRVSKAAAIDRPVYGDNTCPTTADLHEVSLLVPCNFALIDNGTSIIDTPELARECERN